MWAINFDHKFSIYMYLLSVHANLLSYYIAFLMQTFYFFLRNYIWPLFYVLIVKYWKCEII